MFTMVSSSRPEIHIKLEPRCRNVTKQDCVTKWELNSQGRRVRPKQGFGINILQNIRTEYSAETKYLEIGTIRWVT